MLQQWHVDPQKVGARTADAQAVMEESGLSVYARSSLLNDNILPILQSAFECVSPPRYHFSTMFQFLVPIVDTSYDRARTLAIDRISLTGFGASDFSVILDGNVADREWHCEFGIVSEEEVEPRIRRWVSGLPSLGKLPSFVELPSAIAPVSFFADLLWIIPDAEGRGAESAVDIADAVAIARRDGGAIISDLYDQLCEGSPKRLAGGHEL